MMLMMLGSVRGSHDAHLWGGYVVVTVLVCVFSVVRRFGTGSEIDVIDALSGKLPVHVGADSLSNLWLQHSYGVFRGLKVCIAAECDGFRLTEEK